jgi:hypothetical protein
MAAEAEEVAVAAEAKEVAVAEIESAAAAVAEEIAAEVADAKSVDVLMFPLLHHSPPADEINKQTHNK